jgi:hypothetical protein
MATGCLGGMQGGGDPGQTGTDPNGMTNTGNNGVALPPTARQLFDQNVLPMLTGTCASCHAGPTTDGPPFLGTTTDSTKFYGSLWNNARFVNNQPASSVLVTHVHLATSKGSDLTTAQLKYVTDWLNQENVEHVLPPPPTAGNTQAQAELLKFAKCMVQTDYTAAGMNDVQNQDTAGDAGMCWSCHSTGLYVYLSSDATANFAAIQINPTLGKFVEATYNTDGSFKDIVQAYRIQNRGGTPGHPSYTLTATRSTALDTFFNSTYTKYKAGTCP